MTNLQDSIEVWKDIPGFEGRYQISNTGKVKSLNAVSVRTNGRLVSKKEKILSPGHVCFSKIPYEAVNLWKNNKSHRHSMHRLVAASFVENPNSLPDVHHIDNNPLNNHFTNLRWVTHKQNMQESVQSGTCAYKKKKVLVMNSKGEEFMTVTGIVELSKIVDPKQPETARAAIGKICNGRRKLYKNLRFSFI